MTQSKHTIAAFDFDDTLITTDTLPDFLRYILPFPLFVLQTIKALPTLISFKLGFIRNEAAKEQLLTIFLRNMPVSRFRELCQSYRQRLDKLANIDALERIKWHQERGDEVVIISASAEDWILPWAQTHNISSVVATKLATDSNDNLTGKLASPNCHGPEKVRRFLAQYPGRSTYKLYVYGDGKSDQQMFELADFAFKGRFQ